MFADRLSLIAATLLLFSGCLYDPAVELTTCSADSDCPASSVCSAGYCELVDEEPDPDPSGPVSLEIAPASVELSLGDTEELTASALDADGNPVDTEALTWSSADVSVATVDAGAVTATGAGTTTITATLGELEATASVNVLAAVAGVEITPAEPSVPQGRSTTLTARAVDANGDELAGREVVWDVQGDVAVHEGAGEFTGITPGTEVITATIEGVDGTATLTVTDNPVDRATIQPSDGTVVLNTVTDFVPVLEDDQGRLLDPRGRQFSWDLAQFGNASLSTVPNQPEVARVIGTALGENTLFLTVDGTLNTQIDISIVETPVDSLMLNGPSGDLPVGAEETVTVTAFDAAGDEITDRMPTWTSTDDAVATVADEILTAHGPGTATITAQIDEATAEITVTVVFLVEHVSAGATHSCAVGASGAAFCWGANAEGQLGVDPAPAESSTPRQINAPNGGRWTEVYAASEFSCGIDAAGTAYCWGKSGRTGQASPAQTNTPVAVDGGATYVKLSAAWDHACGLTDTGEVHCWGYGGDGRLGLGAGSSANAPAPVSFTPSPMGNIVDIAAGRAHTCAISDMSETYCWGKGAAGALGEMSTQSSNDPVAADVTEDFVSIHAGDQFTCARTSADALWCWGSNGSGRLGIGDVGITSSDVPVLVPGAGPVQVALGDQHGCLVDGGNTVSCWGNPANFRLGNSDDMTVVASPAPINGFSATTVELGATHSCAINDDKMPFCWGSNANGRAGTNAAADIQSPMLVWP